MPGHHQRGDDKKNLTNTKELANLDLALSSAQAIGCDVSNIKPFDFAQGQPHIVLACLWQIIMVKPPLSFFRKR